MIRNAMSRNLLRSIKNSLGRYIAIALIIALGAGIFVGLRMTKADMVATGQKYTDAQNMFDLRLVCSYGWAEEQVQAVREMEGLVDVEGMFYTDLIVNVNQAEDDQVYRFYTIPENINRLVLLGGRMPESPDECLIDGYQNRDEILGKQVVIQENNDEDALEDVKHRTLTIVGYVRSPLYMDMTRGTTSVGNGSIKDCLYVLPGTFDVDYYTEIHATIPGEYKIYSNKYNDAMDAVADRIEPAMEQLALERLTTLRADAEEEYRDGWEEYQDGAKEYAEGLHEAREELRDAYYDLIEGEEEIKDNEKKLDDGEKEIADAWVDIAKGRKELEDGLKELRRNREKAYKEFDEKEAEIKANEKKLKPIVENLKEQLKEVEKNLGAVNSAIDGLQGYVDAVDGFESQLNGIDSEISDLENAIASPGEEDDVDALKEQLEQLKNQRPEAEAKYKEAVKAKEGFESQYGTMSQLKENRSQLEGAQYQLEHNEAMSGWEKLQAGKAEFAAIKKATIDEIEIARQDIRDGEEALDEAEKTLWNEEKKLKDGREELEEAKIDLAEGWVEYEDGMQEAREELTDGRADLDEAREELADARQTIDDMTENTLHILDRNTNVGYASLDSSSDIVEGVSRVFPIFFLLVAALVCITTMTRMVDEERTQIGTLKALGYSNAAIISKYMLYAGTSAVLGCGLGVFMGSIVFPAILWEAYKIMLFIDETVVLTFDFWLCFVVVAAYTVVELLVTWYCCRRALEEVPAELIRPKAPTIGKQLIFERFRFWNKLSFLNKVTIRNIFRYRQRLAMMLVGIGGCTALLLTGFGLRDSIVNIVDFQFQDVTTYDMEVYFEDGQTESQMKEFLLDMKPYSDEILFYHQTSVEIDFDNQVREIYMIAADAGIGDFIDFHHGDRPLPYPGEDEMLLSSGVADALNVKEGDVVTLRDSDMRTMELTVSGIYYNYVYNYTILAPETIEKHWGEEPGKQMAFVRVRDGQEVHQVSAHIVEMDRVMNVSVSEDLAFMVHNMMDALDLVVWVVVFCAALLAATVLYNLTNININERIREIATIKVLGFNAWETGMYIFKENLILSVMGAGAGLILGKLLLDFVMSQVKINMVWFMSRALPLSYGLSVVMTIIMALVVDYVFYFKLQKINMAEALKSVE